MKKSKIIVPALAMIAFSTAASIAGSVAWFTASRQVNVNVGSYAVVKTTTNLDYALAPGIATSVTNNVVDLGGNYLTDTSFNYDNTKIYVPNADGSAIDDTKTVTLANANATNMLRAELTSSNVYSIATFDLTLSMGFGATSGNYGLYLDQAACTITAPENLYTAKGFRMAFIPTGSDPTNCERFKTVFAPLQDFAGCKYVNDPNNKNGTGYDAAANVLVYQGYATSTVNTLPDDNTAWATAKERADCMGLFGYSANDTVELTYKVVVWYEGTDLAVVNQDDPTKYQSVGAILNFKAIKVS